MRLKSAGMRDPAALSNPLGMQRGLPLLPTPTPALLSAQCLVNQLLLVSGPLPLLPSSAADGDRNSEARVVVGAAAYWQGHLLWGSLALGDLEALTLLACRTLGPAAGKKGVRGGAKVGDNEVLHGIGTQRQACIAGKVEFVFP